MQQEKQEGHVGEAPPTEDGVVQKRASISSDSKTGQTDEIPSKGCRGDSDAENPSTICHSAETTPAGGAGGRDISSACITCDWFKDLIIKITTTKIVTKDPILTSIFFTLVGGFIGYAIFESINSGIGWVLSEPSFFGWWLYTILVDSLITSGFFIYPAVLTVLEAVFLVLEVKQRHCSCARRFDQAALWYGLLLENLYPILFEVTGADWMVQLRNNELHTPIYTGAVPTVEVIALISIIGFCYLSFRPMEKMPPLAAVLSISAMYLGIAEVITYTVQIIHMHNTSIILLLLWPACILMMSARTILAKVREFTILPMEKRKIHHNRFLRSIDQFLSKASRWPLCGLVLSLPLLGIIIAILLLFGQAPDSVVKAWTETADWRLSTKQAPQNILVDEHYLCTVAAGGHRKVVRPIRMGIRHGHSVIVNRQLCVANAFEEVIQEKTPRFHRAVRSFYDRFGFPIAKMIHSPWIADLVYFIMKPLEWVFVIVLYLTDVHPENRIAVQYMGEVPQYRH